MNPVLLAAALSMAPAAHAVEELPGRALSWEECVAVAGRLNPDLLSSRLAVEAGGQRYRGSFNGLYPHVSLSNRVTDSDSATGASRWQADGSASLDLFNLASYARISSSSASLKRAEAELAEAEAGRAQAARALRVSRRELSRRLGLGADEVLLASGTLNIGPLPALPDSAALAASHPAVLQSAASESLARAALAEARSAFVPTLSVSAGKSFRGPGYFPEKASWSAAGVLSLPLFGGGPTAAYHDTAAAGRDVAKAGEDLRSAREAVRAGIEASWAGLADNSDQLEVQRGFLEAARQRNEESSVRYSSGLMSFENWEQVVTELVSSERGWVRSRRDAVLAEADWNNSTGRALGE